MPRLSSSSSSSCAVAVAALAWIATAPASAWAKLNSYTITYNYVALDSQYAYAFTQSKAKWESVITGTNSDLTVRFDTASPVLCAGESDSKVPAGTAWDDILVFVKVVDIDGPGNAQNGNILGQSFICRYDSQRPSMPRVGWIELDRYDVNQLHLQGQLVSVVTHEMGHLLGIGSSWTNFKLIKPKKFSYFGASGNAGNVQVGFKGKAVIENRGGPGTARSHWSEAQYKNELMTGYISGSTQPMSKLTVLSLVDMGFKVDASKADAYSKSTANLRGSVPEGEAAARAERKPFHARHTSKEIEPLPLDEDVLVKGE